jgi:glutathione S-transferase
MASQTYTLYYGGYSLCSMMVRLTVALRGQHKDSIQTTFTAKHINIPAKEHITEDYLLHVNRKGQVPALTGSALQEPIADSLLITKYLGEGFPSLAPEQHKAKMVELLDRLHGLNYYSLSYSGNNTFTKWLQGELQQILEGDISEEYRKAIEYKLGV